ncbi:MAG: thiamine-phosphate kinase [Polyangiaceae bacterium]
MKPPAGERAAIALLARLLRAAPPGHGVELGIGDDAAVLRAGAERWVWTIDACIEGVHFDLRYLDLVDVGYRSLMAAASDLAAMGAAPIGALAELGLPKAATPRAVRAIGRGQALAANAIGCPVIGGILSRSTEISVVTTVIGRAKRPLLRRGARAGDDLYLVGEVGLAAFGLELLRRQRRAQSASGGARLRPGGGRSHGSGTGSASRVPPTRPSTCPTGSRATPSTSRARAASASCSKLLRWRRCSVRP